ncbi:hypothetical protein L195_g022296 [Trifolium pratense]|uniref:Uncharacterized protein n=1 Tax=Trifolium pratense TaxID=57577 RepID=A0A2K3N7J7_TRIPR|nr:hypothetical protein L195_g022296 [Trifolium pratense]
MNSRQRPLHACGVSILAIGDIAIGKTQNIKGPLGSTLRNMANLAKFVTPLIYVIQYQWLATLAFIDDRILAAENITEKLFPPSTYVFNKIDEIVLMIVYLPDKLDGALSKYVPLIIHHVPLLEWTLQIVISKLNYLASTLVHENSSVDEKTIGVDSNYCSNNSTNEVKSSASEEFLNLPVDPSSVESFPPIPEADNKGVIMAVSCSHKKKGSYKEVLLESNEKKIECDECEGKQKKIDESTEELDGSKGSYKEVLLESNEKKIEGEGKQKNFDESTQELDESMMKFNVERNENMKQNMKHDPLLELFESAWLMSPASYRNNAEKEN